MYTIRIQNSVNGTWRTTHETSLARAVCLVWGLSTMYRIVAPSGHIVSERRKAYYSFGENHAYTFKTKQVQHAERGLVASWKRKFVSSGSIKSVGEVEHYVYCLRLSDSTLRLFTTSQNAIQFNRCVESKLIPRV